MPNFPIKKAITWTLDKTSDVSETLKTFGLKPHQPTLVLVGGAGGMSDEMVAQTRTFFDDRIVPFVERYSITVVDGGTKSGIMQAIGEARSRHAAHFPLIGVVVGKIAREDPGLLEENHTHLAFVPGENWGDEVPWISDIASQLSAGAASLTLLFNGGQIAWADAGVSVKANRPVLVAEGSGRTADTISETHTGIKLDVRALSLLKTGLVRIENPYLRPENFMQQIIEAFNIK